MTAFIVDRPQENATSGQQPPEPTWPLRVDQYHAMIRAGILTEDDPVELLEGWLIAKMPKNPPHSLATELLRESLTPFLPAGWHIRTQEPITTLDSEPEPDVSLVRGRRRQFAERHPHPHELALVIEVADATLRRDRSTKKQLYAKAGIAVYWIVNLIESQIEVYTQPIPNAKRADYRQFHAYGPTDQVPIVLDGVEVGQVAVKEVLPFAEQVDS